jgi:hypothetical protein
MNRRGFLTALGAVATQRKIGTLILDNGEIDATGQPPLIVMSRYPYLQDVRTDRASILWTTIQPGRGQVNYSSDGVNFRSVAAKSRFFSRAETGLPTGYVQYQADLTGLTPNTSYIYSVTVDGQEMATAGEPRFRTAGPGPFSFVVLGDSGWGDPRSEAQALIAQRIADERPALVIHTGDLVYPMGAYEYYQRNYFNFYARTMCSVPFFPCPGNHDYDIPDAAPYLAIHSVPADGVPHADQGRYYSYDWGNVHFVSIDAHRSLDKAVNDDGPMLRWLDKDLRSTKQFWRVVYFHYPPFATGQNVNDRQSMWVRQYIVPILEQYGVQLVFSGHEHSYQRSMPIRKSRFVAAGAGTNYFTSGGGGAILYPVPDRPMVAFARSTYHYLRVSVDQTTIAIRSIRHDGTECDSYTIAPTPAFSDDASVPPVTIDPGPVPGSVIHIAGRALAAAEAFAATPDSPLDLSGTVVSVNGRPIELLYVSPMEIYARLPFAVEGNLTIRVTTPNGFAERSI